jgi:6-pyruvoyltetrahydropterin/6-carboxytetrahydropterin synthase
LDHSYLNEVQGLENPTTELLAQWIWNNLKKDLKSLYSITVSEGNNYGCTYWGENA